MGLFNRTSKDVGNQAERLARDYLQGKGLKLLQQNFNCKLGEIDLIMQDGNDIVFVEVRYRRRKDFGSAADSVTRQKQNKLIKTALFYLQSNPVIARRASRFDVVAIHQGSSASEIDWIKNAFQCESF